MHSTCVQYTPVTAVHENMAQSVQCESDYQGGDSMWGSSHNLKKEKTSQYMNSRKEISYDFEITENHWINRRKLIELW